jgi:hypothetical protein
LISAFIKKKRTENKTVEKFTYHKDTGVDHHHRDIEERKN